MLCAHQGKVYVDGLCYGCYQDRQVEHQLTQIHTDFKPKNTYNQHLFDLYLAYIKRYRLHYFHLDQADNLRKILENDIWPTIKSWHQIYQLSSHYKLSHKNGKQNGCAVKKIGFMLEELQILTSKDRDLAASFCNLVNRFDNNMTCDIENYSAWMRSSRRTESTILCNLRSILNFHQWLKSVYPQIEFKMINETRVLEYLEEKKNTGYSSSSLRRCLHSLRRFYAWLCHRKKILYNPLQNLDIPNHHKKINILSDADISALIKLIKHPNTDPESALCLGLILFWGFTTEDLLHAGIEHQDKKLCIVLNPRERSYGRHYHNRDQILILPDNPPWLCELQKRFLRQWSKRYDKTAKTYPIKPLLLTKSGTHARGISDLSLRQRIKVATTIATGKEINPKILRQTCGHLYSQNGDGALLTRLGWSPSFAFHYTWLPRKIFAE